nr:prephenate dehydrogenase/arogenate dehydrogenase family protein [Chitinophagaceae bacterium]
MKTKNIAIVGVGLMGGSLALQCRAKGLAAKIIGVDNSKEHAKKALALGLVDEMKNLEVAIQESDVIVLSVPVDLLIELLPWVLDKTENQIVMDVGSTKELLLKRISSHPKRGRYVSTHPMWGTEYSGPQAAEKNAFENKAVVIVNGEASDKDALDWVTKMYKKIGMHVLNMKAADHDVHTAYVSHISHITSFALANTVLEKE